MGSEYIRNNGKYKQLSPEELGKIEAYLTLIQRNGNERIDRNSLR